MPALTPLHTVVGGMDLTYEAENIQFSNADPGGYEVASFDVQSGKADRLLPGMKVVIHDGIDVVWLGRVAEPAKMIKHGWQRRQKVGSSSTRISCEGAGAVLKDNNFSMVYIDRDLSRWQSWSAQRQLAIVAVGANTQEFSWSALPDSKNGNPCIDFTGPGQLVGNPTIEAWYDSGPLNKVAYLRCKNASFINYGADVKVVLKSGASDADDASVNSQTQTYPGTPPQGSNSYALATPTRYCYFQHQYNSAAAAGVAGTTYGYQMQNVSVIGNHGLTLRGSPTYTGDGFYPSDIAQHAATLAAYAAGPGSLKMGQVDTTSAYTVLHYVQYLPVAHQTAVDDMAKLASAHWGVWAPAGLFDDVPEFHFRVYPTVANRFVNVADCDEADISERLANMYTSATITYQDAAGTAGAVTVTLPNSVLDRVGVQRNTTLDLGTASAATATVFANFVLQALFAQARAAGSVQLPRQVKTRSGGLTAAYRLRAGIDRLRVADLPSRSGLFLGGDSDSFRISRVECQLETAGGTVQTRVEVDAGPNLIDTIQARLAIAAKLSGF